MNKFNICHGFGCRNLSLHDVISFAGVGSKFQKTRQVHSGKVDFLTGETDELSIADAWVTSRPGTVCYVKTADCLPLLLADPHERVIAAVHAGWKGILAGIVNNALKAMIQRGAKRRNVISVIGPRIRMMCYEVKRDFVMTFKKRGWNSDQIIISRDGKYFFSLARAVRSELLKNGIDEDNIDLIQKCTFCRDKEFFSYRREKSEKGRQISYIVL